MSNMLGLGWIRVQYIFTGPCPAVIILLVSASPETKSIVLGIVVTHLNIARADQQTSRDTKLQ